MVIKQLSCDVADRWELIWRLSAMSSCTERTLHRGSLVSFSVKWDHRHRPSFKLFACLPITWQMSHKGIDVYCLLIWWFTLHRPEISTKNMLFCFSTFQQFSKLMAFFPRLYCWHSFLVFSVKPVCSLQTSCMIWDWPATTLLTFHAHPF